MFIEERHQQILELIKQNGRISIGDIQEKFEVSMDSARRDLRILEEKGLLKRTHGGAIPLRQVAFGRPPKFTCKDMSGIFENYLQIALKAVSMIENDDVVFIIAASVGYHMVHNLPDNIKIRVVTNSIVLAEELRLKDNISVILIGGEMDQKGNCYNGFATEMIKKLRFDKSFITSASISAEFGLSIQNSSAIAFYESVINSSKKAIGLFPTEKIGFESIVSVCPSEKLDILITDWDAPEEELKKFDELGVEVMVVEKP